MRIKNISRLGGLVLVILAVSMITLLGCSTQETSSSTTTTQVTNSSSVSSSTTSKVIELKFSHPYPPISPYVPCLEAWGKKVEEVTGGQVKIVFYPSGSLVADTDQYPALLNGVSDIAIVTAWTVPELQFESIYNLPVLGWSDENCLDIRNQMDKEFPQMAAVRSQVKTLYLMNTSITGCVLTRNKEIHAPDDLKGLLMISPATMNTFWTTCGATGVGLMPTEFYSALEKGVADGVGAGYSIMAELGLDEVIKFSLELPLAGSSMDVMMNLNKWNSLSADLQKAMESTFPDVEQALMNAEMTSAQETRSKVVAENKIKISVATQDEIALWSEKALPSHTEWIASMKEKGYPSQEAYDKLIEIIKQYK